MRKLLIYLLCLNISFLPSFNANAFMGAVAVAFLTPLLDSLLQDYY